LSIYVPSLTEIDSYGKEKASSLDRVLACAYIRIEIERKKGTGFIFKQPEERISFLVQVLWPFALIKRPSNKVTVFDTIGFMKRYFEYGDTTKLNDYSDQIQKCNPSLMSRLEFHKTLQRFASYFEEFDKKKSHEILGCFPEPGKALNILGSLSTRGFSEIDGAICPSMTVDSKKACTSVDLLSKLRKDAENDIARYREVLPPLDSILQPWHQQIDEEIKQKRLPYDKKIEKITPQVERRISQIESEPT
jgi:hypothetical protein